MKTKKPLRALLLLISLGVAFSWGGYAFFQQLRNQFLSKATLIRSQIVRFERLPTGELAICNLDKKVGLIKLALRASEQNEFTLITDSLPLGPDACGVSRQYTSDITHFRALWESEKTERWETVLTYPKALHEFHTGAGSTEPPATQRSPTD
jgi:hypothetical protein